MAGSTFSFVERLLGHLHRVFDKTARPAPMILFTHTYAMDFVIAEGVLTATRYRPGNPVPTYSWSWTLADYTIGTLATAIAGETGFSVLFVSADYSSRSALILYDQTGGSQDEFTGDYAYGYTSHLWEVFHPIAVHIRQAWLDVVEAVNQIYLGRAEGDYLGVHGDYYGLARAAGESDDAYLARIIAYVLMARNSNIAIQLALARLIGCPPEAISVRDAEGDLYGGASVYDGAFNFDGTRWFNGVVNPVVIGLYRCQFVVSILDSAAVGVDLDALRDTINEFKAAGTRLLSLYNGTPLVYDGTFNYDDSERFDGRIIL